MDGADEASAGRAEAALARIAHREGDLEATARHLREAVQRFAKGGEKRAEGQISFRYGHVGLPFTAAWPMDQSWEALEPSLGFES